MAPSVIARSRLRSATSPLLLAGLLLTATPAPAQQPGERSYRDVASMPGGVAGRRIQALIETVNANDPDRVRRFLEEEYAPSFRAVVPLEEHLNVFAFLSRDWGGIDFHGIRSYDPPRVNEVVVILKDRNYGAWRAFTLRFAADGDSLITSLGFNVARTPSDVAEPALTEGDVIAEANVLLTRLCERDVFSGTVLVARGDSVLLTRACGEASKRFHVPNNLETKFNLGSMNKMFTATAIVQLVERGVLAYDEPISRYVDTTWLPRAITDRVTIHHLLTHTSGLGSYFNEVYQRGSRELYRDVEDFKPLVVGDTLAFEPGTRFRYSNTGMLLLGVVIERATGQSYFDYIREHIYEPAGMLNSDSYDMDQPVENLAIGYDRSARSPSGWENNLFKHVIKGGPAGGGFSTVGDLHRFARALLAERLISRASLERMWTDHSGEGYGYGFGITEGPAGRVVGHSGGFAGINANLDIFVDRGYVVAVLSNYGNGATPLAQRIAQLIGRIQG